MNLNWFQSVVYGFLSGLMDILPVSAQAHKVLLLKFFGIKGDMSLMDLMIRFGIFAALYFSCQAQLIRMSRARALARIPKRKRKRPLDTRSLMDLSLLKTMLVPVILGLLLSSYTAKWNSNLMAISIFLFLNGIILYAPQFLPSGNRDSRTMSRVEGFLMGLGGGASVLPGISAIGVCVSVGSVCGVDRNYSLNMALLMNLFLTLGNIVLDLVNMVGSSTLVFGFSILLRCLFTAICSCAAAMLGIRLMRRLAQEQGYSLFGLYCLGVALFTFILNLMA